MNIASFNQQRLAAQYDTFGEPATIGGLSCVVCAGGHESRAQLGDGGVAVDFDRVARARMSDLASAPAPGAKAVIGGISYRVASVRRSFHGGEYVLGLEQIR